jgi:hypothetical protein
MKKNIALSLNGKIVERYATIQEAVKAKKILLETVNFCREIGSLHMMLNNKINIYEVKQ